MSLLGEFGFVAVLMDTEGNMIGLLQENNLNLTADGGIISLPSVHVEPPKIKDEFRN